MCIRDRYEERAAAELTAAGLDRMAGKVIDEELFFYQQMAETAAEKNFDELGSCIAAFKACLLYTSRCV